MHKDLNQVPPEFEESAMYAAATLCLNQGFELVSFMYKYNFQNCNCILTYKYRKMPDFNAKCTKSGIFGTCVSVVEHWKCIYDLDGEPLDFIIS